MTANIISTNPVKVKHYGPIPFNQRMEAYVTREILSGSNELAGDILAIHGFTEWEKDGFASFTAVHRFYGVTPSYMGGVLKRHLISPKHMPEDVRKNGTGTVFSLSPRVVLALSALMHQGRNIPADSRVSKVYKSLANTRYYLNAQKVFERVGQTPRLEELPEKAELTENGQILIPVDSLYKLIERSLGAAQPEPYVPYKGCKKAVIAEKGGKRSSFSSIADCANFLGVNRTQVSEVARGIRADVKGYHITYA